MAYALCECVNTDEVATLWLTGLCLMILYARLVICVAVSWHGIPLLCTILASVLVERIMYNLHFLLVSASLYHVRHYCG